MGRFVTLLVGILLLATAPGCARRSEEAFMKRAVKLTEQWADIVSKIETSGDVDKYKGKLEKLRLKIKKLKTEMKDFKEKKTKKYKDRGEKAEKKLEDAMKDLKPEVVDELSKLELDELLPGLKRMQRFRPKPRKPRRR